MSKQHEPGIADREWEAQERALQEERTRATAAEAGKAGSDGTLVRTYRVLARLLGQPIENGLPPDFAADVARIAREQQRAAARASVESTVARALGAAFVAAVVVFSLMNGEQWLALVDFDSTAVQWLLAAAGCVGLTTLIPSRARRTRRVR
jgi:hypothetical protein